MFLILGRENQASGRHPDEEKHQIPRGDEKELAVLTSLEQATTPPDDAGKFKAGKMGKRQVRRREDEDV